MLTARVSVFNISAPFSLYPPIGTIFPYRQFYWSGNMEIWEYGNMEILNIDIWKCGIQKYVNMEVSKY